MEDKAEQLYKQSGCRFDFVQLLEGDPEGRSYIWAEGAWLQCRRRAQALGSIIGPERVQNGRTFAGAERTGV